MTPIAARARVPNPFERFSEIAFGLIMAVSFSFSLNAVATKSVSFEQRRKNAKSISDLRLQRKTAVIDAFEKASNVLDDKQKHKLHEVVAELVDEAWENEHEAEADETEE